MGRPRSDCGPQLVETALSAEQSYEQALEVARRALPDIIAAIVVKAQEGSYQHAKFLLELVGTGKPIEEHDDSEEVVGKLLEELLKEPVDNE